MPLLGDREKTAVTELFQKLDQPVKLVHFTQELMCDTCPDARRILEEVAALSEKITLDVHNYTLEKEAAAAYQIDKIPATVVQVGAGSRVRFYGLPSGYEFTSLLNAILASSRSETGLSEASKTELRSITTSTRIQVFVTPT